jgi:RNA polymerase sigma factor (sigma-70 family)
MVDLLQAQRKARPAVSAILRWSHPNDVEDALQTAALKAWKNCGAFKRRSSYDTWFTRIAINEALMIRRCMSGATRDERKNVELDAAEPNALDRMMASDEPNPEQLAEWSERAEKLYAAMLKLSPTQKRAALRWLAGEHLDGSGEKAARHVAKVKLRKWLEEVVA